MLTMTGAEVVAPQHAPQEATAMAATATVTALAVARMMRVAGSAGPPGATMTDSAARPAAEAQWTCSPSPRSAPHICA